MNYFVNNFFEVVAQILPPFDLSCVSYWVHLNYLIYLPLRFFGPRSDNVCLVISDDQGQFLHQVRCANAPLEPAHNHHLALAQHH